MRSTTLLSHRLYPKTDLQALYGLRWQVELYLRHLKATMGMDILTTQTPERVRKELECYLLADNLLRTVMWDAGSRHRVPPLRLS